MKTHCGDTLQSSAHELVREWCASGARRARHVARATCRVSRRPRHVWVGGGPHRHIGYRVSPHARDKLGGAHRSLIDIR